MPLNDIDRYDGKCTTLYYTTLQYTSLHYTAVHFTTLHCSTLHYTTLQCTSLHYMVLHHHANININPHVLYSPLLTTHLFTTHLLTTPLLSSLFLTLFNRARHRNPYTGYVVGAGSWTNIPRGPLENTKVARLCYCRTKKIWSV